MPGVANAFGHYKTRIPTVQHKTRTEIEQKHWNELFCHHMASGTHDRETCVQLADDDVDALFNDNENRANNGDRKLYFVELPKQNDPPGQRNKIEKLWDSECDNLETTHDVVRESSKECPVPQLRKK